MESKHKNALIGALLAVVFVMAVGYETKTGGPGVIDATAGIASGKTPTGTIGYDNGNHNANISATLYQPGDTVLFTLTIVNNGTIPATVGAPTVAMDGDEADEPLIARKGNIQFTVTAADTKSINQTETVTMTVKAEFISSATSIGDTTTADVTINMNASQATA